MLQVQPDWTATYRNANELKLDLGHFIKFTGPGYYISREGFFLILPVPRKRNPNPKTVWHQHQPRGTKWNVYCYSCPISKTIFGAHEYPPTRQDDRE